MRKLAYARRQTSLSEAYRHLAKITTLKDVPVRLHVTKDREMVSDTNCISHLYFIICMPLSVFMWDINNFLFVHQRLLR